MAFGDRAGAARPLNLRDRGAFHRAELAAEADWEVDGHVKELPTNETNRRPRWRIKLKGVLRKMPEVELTPSYEESGMAIVVRNVKLDGDAGWTDVPHSTLWACSRSVRRRTSTLQTSQTESLL